MVLNQSYNPYLSEPTYPAACANLDPQNRISYNPSEQESAQLGSWRLWPFMTHVLTWLYPNHTDAAQLGPVPIPAGFMLNTVSVVQAYADVL